MQNKYPTWKNVALFIIAVLGLIYAIPNLYSDDPAVQISTDTAIDMEQLKQDVVDILDHAHLDYDAVSESNERVEVRFSSTDNQLLARDEIKTELGSGYTVALNLVPATLNLVPALPRYGQANWALQA